MSLGITLWTFAKEAKVNAGSFCNIVPCGPEGEFNSEFCCSSFPGNASCCSSTFFNMLGYPITFPTNSSSSTITTPSNTTANTTGTSATSRTDTTPTSRSKASSDSSTVISAGVGVPLGVLLLSSLCYLFYRERKLRLKAETLMQNNQQSAEWGQEKKTQK